MSVATARIWSPTVCGDSSSYPCTPSVFWMVTAVIAVMPNTPRALNVLRSAWMPAPPPESLPAIVNARGLGASVGKVIPAPRLDRSLRPIRRDHRDPQLVDELADIGECSTERLA